MEFTQVKRNAATICWQRTNKAAWNVWRYQLLDLCLFEVKFSYIQYTHAHSIVIALL